MKKTQVLVLVAVFALTISGLALAQMDKGKEMMGDKGMGMMKGDMMDKGGMMGGKMMGMCPMMQSMMQKSVVATTDGGIIVVTGNKLTKYDKDLNVVKEVELKMDMEGMQKQMMDMMQNCPMMKGMMNKSESPKDSGEDSKASQETTEKSEHESHH